MPNLADCSDEELAAVLPGVSRGPLPGAAVDMAPLRAYQRAIRKRVDRGIIPGYCSLVLWRGTLLHADAYGCADLERQLPMRTDTLARLYCLSKAVTATALMLLVESGACALEDEVGKFIPAFRGLRVAADAEAEGDRFSPSGAAPAPPRPVTLRRLLTHTSGLGYGKEFNLPPESPCERAYASLVEDVERGRVQSLGAFCERLAALPLRQAPGEDFRYSYGTDVVGRVIEVASGQSLDRFLEERLFGPLGMADTGFAVRREALPRLAALYGSFETARALGEAGAGASPPACDWTLTRLDGAEPAASAWLEGRHCAVLSGGGLMGHNRGGLVSTLNDQARFCLMLAGRGRLPGGPRILRESTVEAMVASDWLSLPTCLGRRPVATSTTGVAASGAFGWNGLCEIGVVADPKELSPDAFELDEYGYGGAAETFWSVNPRRELVVLWFTQQVDNRSWTAPAANLWIAARKAVAKARLRTNGVNANGAAAKVWILTDCRKKVRPGTLARTTVP